MSQTRYQSPLWVNPPPIKVSAKEQSERDWKQIVRDAYMLDTSAGQLTMLAAVSRVFDVPMHSVSRRVQEGYSAFDDDLTGYEQHYDEFVGSTSPEETRMIKQMIDINSDLRNSVGDSGLLRFGANMLDPINVIPIRFAIGQGAWEGFKRAVKVGAPINTGTEIIRHVIDPTSTATETAMNSLAGTLFMGVMGGAVGRVPPDATKVGDVLNKFTPPPGQTGMSIGVPWHMGGTKGAFKRMTQALRSNAAEGDPLSWSVKPERIKVRELDAEDGSRSIEISVDDQPVTVARVTDDAVEMVSVDLPPGMRQQGIGVASYKEAIAYAEKHGLKFKSGKVVTPDAQKRWDALEDEGYKVKKVDDEKLEIDSDGNMKADDSVFEMIPQVDPKGQQIPRQYRETIESMRKSLQIIARHVDEANVEVRELAKKVKNAPIAGGAKTKAKAQLKKARENRRQALFQHRKAEADYADITVKAARMLDGQTIKDWDLLPTGYNKILGKTDQFPWWALLRTPLRDLAPEVAVKYQRFAIKFAATPGLNNKGNRVGANIGPSIESLSFEYQGKWLEAARESHSIYRQYAGHGKSSSELKHFIIDSSQRAKSSINRMMGGDGIRTTSDGKMTIQEFETQISIAMSNGGRHKVPEVVQAAKLYREALEEIGEEAKKFAITSSQKSIESRMVRLDDKIMRHDKNYGPRNEQKPWQQQMVDGLELERMRLEEVAETYRNTKNINYIHRMWLAEEVRAKEVELKAILTREFTENPPHVFKDKDGNIKPEDPDVIAGRVNEAYASILREADHGNDLQFKPDDTDTLSWLDAREQYLRENPDGYPPKTVQTQLDIIERKRKRIEEGDLETATGGPLGQRNLDLNDQELIELGVIESNVNNWMNHYVTRTAPLIETARIFGDAKAQKYIDDLTAETHLRADNEPNPKKAEKIRKEADRQRENMVVLRDIVHGVYQIPDDPSAITGRLLRMLRNFNILGAMGRSVFMAVGDLGNVVVSQGFIRTMRHGIEAFASGVSDGNIKMMRKEVDLAGATSEVILGMRYMQMTDAGAAVGRATKFEQSLAGASQRFFLLNLLGPWTDMARRFSGGMLQSRLIENSLLWKQGKLPADEIEIMSRLNINKQQAIQFADEWQKSGSHKHKSMYIANTSVWASREAQRTFRAAMNTEINRMVPTPGAVDKPKALLKGEWWKVIGQYRGFSIAATHRIMGAGLQTKGASKFSGAASMIGIAMMVDALKRPDYIQMPIEEQVLRAVELSGVTGVFLDLNDTLERASGGDFGIRPALGMDIRERNPNWANRMGTLGAVPNQWMTLIYSLTSDEANSSDLARAIRYMIPYNNLLYWNEGFTRAQRAAADYFEEDD